MKALARHGYMATARKTKWFEKMMAEDCGSSICYSIRILMYVSESEFVKHRLAG